MTTIQDLLDHASETFNTLNDNGYFNQLKAMGGNASKNLKSNFPVLASKNPTIDDIINSSLNVGGVGTIKKYVPPLNVGGVRTIKKYVPPLVFDRLLKNKNDERANLAHFF